MRAQPIAVVFDRRTSPRQRDWLRRAGIPVSCQIRRSSHWSAARHSCGGQL